jgi:ATP-dependent RNA circularization protein (DNA/RNA ligase family)
MKEYHKIQSVFLRDPANRHKTFLMGQYSEPSFEYLKDNEWVFTEKVDGTNIRVGWDGRAVSFGGRTDDAQTPTFLLNKLAERFPLVKLSSVFPDYSDVVLYGEGYGAKIQKGGGNYIPDGQDFVLFDVMIGGNFLERKNVEDIADKLGIKVVPIRGRGTLAQMIEYVSAGFSSEWGPFIAEGVVARPTVEMRDRLGHRVITKVKHKDFAQSK